MHRIRLRDFFELKQGDRFLAMLLDIRPGELKIKFECGGTYAAKTLVLPNAHIGDDCLFHVKENDHKGRIVLEMLKGNDRLHKKKYDMRV